MAPTHFHRMPSEASPSVPNPGSRLASSCATHLFNSLTLTNLVQSCVPRGTTPTGHGASATTWLTKNEGQVRAIVDPISHPPGWRRRRHCCRNRRGDEVDGSTCSRTSKRVTTWNFVSGGSDAAVGCSGMAAVRGEAEPAVRASSVVFSYLNLPDCRWACSVGSVRACDRAMLIIVGDGSMARIDDAPVDVVDAVEPASGMVLARDSAKIPPPQPISRYLNPASPPLMLPSVSDGVSVVFELPAWGCASERQEARNSWRSGFMRCRMRDGPSGSHQLLASDEKCVSSSCETDDEDEWRRKNRVVV